MENLKSQSLTERIEELFLKIFKVSSVRLNRVNS